jgi:diacylglycerol kinase family enzyme
MPALVLLNPKAAGGRAGAFQGPLQAWLAHHFPEVALVIPDSVASALATLQNCSQHSRVVMVGGDGTLNRMLPALRERQLITGLLPFGSGNDMARALGLLGKPWQQALAHALTAPARAIDLGSAQWDDSTGSTRTVAFISSFSVGFDASVGLRASQGPRWLRGMPRYLLATLQELRHFQLWPLTLSCEGAPVYSGPALLAASLNSPTYGGGMRAAPPASLVDGQLDLLLGSELSVGATLRLLPALLLGRHLGLPKVTHRRYQTLQVNSTQDFPIAADGEYLGDARSLEIRTLAGALQMVA